MPTILFTILFCSKKTYTYTSHHCKILHRQDKGFWKNFFFLAKLFFPKEIFSFTLGKNRKVQNLNKNISYDEIWNYQKNPSFLIGQIDFIKIRNKTTGISTKVLGFQPDKKFELAFWKIQDVLIFKRCFLSTLWILQPSERCYRPDIETQTMACFLKEAIV